VGDCDYCYYQSKTADDRLVKYPFWYISGERVTNFNNKNKIDIKEETTRRTHVRTMASHIAFRRLIAGRSRSATRAGAAALALGIVTLTAVSSVAVPTSDNRFALTESSPASSTPGAWKRLPNPSDKTTEKITKTQFVNAVVREDMDDKLLRLCAVSVRCMLGMCFLDRARAYSFGIYLGSSAVEDLCGENGSYEKLNPVPKQGLGPGPFYAAPRYAGFRDGYVFQNGPSGLGYYRDPRAARNPAKRVASPVLIRLVMLHDVDGEHLAHGFEKTLKPRVQQHMKDSTEELAQITRLKNTFNKLGKIEKDSVFDL